MFRGIYLLLSFIFCSGLFAQDIYVWHGFDGFLKEAFEELAQDFNNHSGIYRIIPIKKGTYKEVVESGLKAFDEKKHPHLLQGYEVATLTLMEKKDVFIPVDELMRKFHKHFDPNIFIDVIRYFYSNEKGKMYSFPWNASTGVLFYNKELFEKIGLNPNEPPKTWEEIEEMGKKIIVTNVEAFTTAWPYAYHLEHLRSLHNMPFSSHENGFGGLKARLVFNDAFQQFHLSKLVEWHKKGLFHYYGRLSEAPENAFTTGKCAILMQGANRLALLKRNASFSIGVGYLPYWKKFVEAPYTLNIGGASFWVMKGYSDDEYRGIAQFLEYLSLAEVQAHWHQKTGYLPVTEAAYYLTKKSGFYKCFPEAEIPVIEVMQRPSTPFTRGIRLGNYMEVREVIADHLEKAFQEDLSPQEALDGAIEKGNQILENFESIYTERDSKLVLGNAKAAGIRRF